ncbi:MAG: alanine dehydrogenase [Bacillota bacterium]
MIIGIPKEIKDNENRVGMTPAGVESLIHHSHQVLVEAEAGAGSGFTDDEYRAVGARILSTAKEVYQSSDMIIKVKEPLPPEYGLLRPGQILFTYLHLAADKELTEALLQARIVGIAYETIQEDNGLLPLLRPMSEVAGRMSALVAAYHLARPFGGRGVLAPGVPGVAPGTVVILGGGTVGFNAAQVACGIGARVIVLEADQSRIRYLDSVLPRNSTVIASNTYNIARAISEADAVIGAVLIPGARAPRLVTRDMLKLMKPGAVIVDVAVDQGGCVETTHPTTHSNPTYVVDDVLHYAVANMPGAYPRTSTLALSAATLPCALEIANKGYRRAMAENRALRRGLSVHKGLLTCKPVAEAHLLEYVPVDEALAS